MRKVDVIVLGAGISGCIAAALLARKGYQVAMISREREGTYRLPESWVYDCPSSLLELKMGEKILPLLKKQSQCIFCSSDREKTITFSVKDTEEIEKGDVVWIDRSQLDRLLVERALEQGVFFQPFSTIIDCQISSSEAILSIETQNGKEEWQAHYLFDATGKTAFLSGHLNLPMEEKKLDSRIAYFSHFEVSHEMIHDMEIIAIEGGYIFCIPIADHRLSIGCVVGEDGSIDPPEVTFAAAIASSSYITNVIERGKRVLPVIAAKNYHRICLEPAGLNYRLIGDAAAFLDPFFCPGIDFAFFSAEQAVESMKSGGALSYQNVIAKWLKDASSNIYEKMASSEWNAIVRLFADPHLPWVVPLSLTQAFCSFNRERLSFKERVESSREAYAVASY